MSGRVLIPVCLFLVLSVALVQCLSIRVSKPIPNKPSVKGGHPDDVCTRFSNSTQPFDFFLLSLQWPGSSCDGRNDCKIPTFVKDFTIHGLWPNSLNTQHAECCYPNKFDENLIAPILNDMKNQWPSFFHTNDQFWGHEWEKHGTCSNFTTDLQQEQLIYFGATLKFHKQINLGKVLADAGIVPSRTPVARADMVKAMKAAGYDGVIHCERDDETITEIRFCVHKTTLEFFECTEEHAPHGTCQDKVLYPPIKY